MNNNNITFITSSLAGGGAEGVCVNIANGLALQGWDVTLVVLNMRDSVFHTNVSRKVNFVVLDVNHARHAFVPLYRYLSKNKVTKIVAFNYDTALLLILVRLLFPINYLVLTRNINSLTNKMQDSSGGWRKKLVMWLTKRIYGKADHVINQCQAMESDLLTVFPTLIGKTSVIYNPVNPQIEDYLHSTKPSSKNNIEYLLCVGRLEKQKAFHCAIEAFAGVSKRHPSLRLVIIGEGSLRSELELLSEKLSVASKIDFKGFISDTKPFYAGATATLLTSLYEGFPNVLVESISLGTPVISFDCSSGPSEIVIPRQNGLLVENKNLAAFQDSIDYIIENKNDFDSDAIIATSTRFASHTILKQWMSLISSDPINNVK